jgi:hypothetical protein
VLLAVAGAGGVLALGACASDKKQEDIILNPTPVVMTESLTGTLLVAALPEP